MALAGCRKDEQGMQLIAEGFGGTKAAVDGLYSYWVDGETVRINGVNKTVAYDGTTAYISGVAEAGVYRALYPDTLNSTAVLTSDEVQVTIPHTYTYRESDGHQRLGVPMAAYGTSSSRLLFQHLTAALTVEIKNTYGFTIEVDSVVVESNLYQLSGEREVTLAASIDVGANSSGVAAAERRVAVLFDGGTRLQVLAGETRRVQVPVLPVGDDNRFTIRVGVHKVDDADVRSTFERTQAGGQAGYALARRQMGYAGVSFGSGFSVAAGQQVIIAQGNLRYVPSTGTWSFHSHQYDICEVGPVDSTTRYRSDGDLPIDLFGYGTSGHDNMYPYMTSKVNTDYRASISSLAKTDFDWGWYNAIANGGNTEHQWYSLTSEQWKYVFNTRTPTTAGVNSNNSTRYTYATIGGSHKGIILFPDVYVHPSGITPMTDATFNSYSNFTAAVSYADWNKMEAAGAVFLPAAGYRLPKDMRNEGCHYIQAAIYGMYWTASSLSSETAYRVRFYGTLSLQFATADRSNGMSVRVVKDLD
ncbi:MAG: hypothetical protein IJ524_09570 [Bacteroidales bacterium]|nr:hypothetical protein [Bacteroidales bacterium]